MTRTARKPPTVIFGIAMLAIQAYIFFGPPLLSDKVAGATALAAYVFALVIALLEKRPPLGTSPDLDFGFRATSVRQ